MKVTQLWTKSTIAGVMLGLSVIPLVDATADDKRKAVSPDESVMGMTQGDWGAAWWQWALSIPADRNPILDPDGSFCAEGQGSGPVFFLAGTWVELDEGGRTCSVPAGQFIFFPLVNTECSEAEDGTDWYCATEAACRECAGRNANTYDPDSLVLIVDGKKLKDLDEHRFQSAAYYFTLPDDNILGEDETKSISVADGYWVMLNPLPPGKHTIHFEGGPYDGSWLQDVTYTITVE
ncbi:MAG: hypothetical protein QNJ78_08450 [Gammaproteobacteria bacterium]|nr:hypothetical protein [Gammaproteobacteria bacterium]